MIPIINDVFEFNLTKRIICVVAMSWVFMTVICRYDDESFTEFISLVCCNSWLSKGLYNATLPALSSHLFSGPAYPSSFGSAGFVPLSAPISLSQASGFMPLSFQAEAFEESETLVDDYDVKDFYPTTTPPPVRGIYHLEKFPWADSILDLSQDALVLQLNETVILKLTRDTNVPKSSAGDADCTNAVQGGAGLCVYLTRCESAQNITEDDYKSNYCLVDQTYAGVCCPKKDIDL